MADIKGITVTIDLNMEELRTIKEAFDFVESERTLSGMAESLKDLFAELVDKYEGGI